MDLKRKGQINKVNWISKEKIYKKCQKAENAEAYDEKVFRLIKLMIEYE